MNTKDTNKINNMLMMEHYVVENNGLFGVEFLSYLIWRETGRPKERIK